MPGPKQNTKRTLLGNSTYIFLIRLFPALAGLMVIIVFSRRLNAEFYGFYQDFWIKFQVYYAIACLGIPALLLTYPLDRIRQFLSTATWRLPAGLCLWILLASGLFSYQTFREHSLFYTFFPLAFLALHVLIAVCEAYLIVGRKFSFIAAGSTLYSLYFVGAHALLLFQKIDFKILLLLLLAGCVLRGGALVLKARQLYNHTPAIPTSGKALVSVRSLWLHLGIYDILQTVFRWADKFIMTFFLSHELLAVYVNGTVDIPVLPLMLGAVGSAMLLHLGQGSASNAERIHLLKNSSARLALVVFPLFFFFVFFRYELFTSVFTHRYKSAVPLFLISSLVIPLRAYNFTSILQSRGKGRIINTGAVLDLALALVLIYPLYLFWNLRGVAMAFVISTYAQAAFYLWHTAKALRCSMTDLLPLRSWLVSGGTFLLVFFIGHYLLVRHFNDWYTLLLGSCLLAITFSVIVIQQLLANKKR